MTFMNLDSTVTVIIVITRKRPQWTAVSHICQRQKRSKQGLYVKVSFKGIKTVLVWTNRTCINLNGRLLTDGYANYYDSFREVYCFLIFTLQIKHIDFFRASVSLNEWNEKPYPKDNLQFLQRLGVWKNITVWKETARCMAVDKG